MGGFLGYLNNPPIFIKKSSLSNKNFITRLQGQEGEWGWVGGVVFFLFLRPVLTSA